MRFSNILCGFLAINMYSGSAGADEDFAKVNEKATQIAPGLYMIEGAGGNITASIGADGTFLVDDDLAAMSEKLIAKLKALGGGAPRIIVNTHFHYDHTDGNKILAPGAVVIANSNVRDRLMHEQTLWHEQHAAFSRLALPTVTFEHELTLHLNDAEIKVLHYPHAHTDGDSAVFFENGKVVSMGDLYFSGMYPIFHPEHRGSLMGLVTAIESVIRAIPTDARIVPGHGPLSSKADLEKYHDMIRSSITVVRTGLLNGKTLDQITKEGLPKKWDAYSHGYTTTAQWLAAVYVSLKERP